MGATASRTSPNPPSSCTVVNTESETRLFTVPDYSVWSRMPAGTALNFDTFYVRFSEYRLKVYPSGLDTDSADSVAVFVSGPFDHQPGAAARVHLEILDATGRHVVFDNHTARSEQTTLGGAACHGQGCYYQHDRCKGYARFVRRRELEASCCVRPEDDSFLVRCTVSADRESTQRLVSAPAPAPEAAEGAAAAAAGSRTVTVAGFSLLRAALRTGECARSAQFCLGGSCWYLKVYPNGRCEDSSGHVSVFLGRGRSDEPATAAEFCLEVVQGGRQGKDQQLTKKCTFDEGNPEHGFPRLVASSDLEWADQLMAGVDGRLVVRCRLRVTKMTAPSLLPAAVPPPPPPPTLVDVAGGKERGGTLGVVGETENDQDTGESDEAPLLGFMFPK